MANQKRELQNIIFETMAIKILNVINGGLSSDGVTTMWYTYCKEMKRQGLDKRVKMVFPYIEGMSLPSVEEKFNGIRVATPHVPCRHDHPIKYFFSLLKLLKQEKYDIIQVNGSSSVLFVELLAGWLNGIEIRLAHSRNTQCYHNNFHNFFKPLFRILCNERFACGEDAGKWLFPNQNFIIIHNGKDFSDYKYSEEERKALRSKYGLEGKYVIGHVGKFIKTKNHSFLLEVFQETKKIIPDSILYLMGEGEEMDSIKALVIEKGLTNSVIFAGLVTDMPKRLQAMDIMLLPSLFEGLPNVVIEWQAMGLPCIVSDGITKECALSDLVTFMSLSSKSNEWAYKIREIKDSGRIRLNDASNSSIILRKSGYDIKEGALFLVKKYEEIVIKHKRQ